MWKSSEELDAELKTFSELPGLDRLNSLSTFWRFGFYPAGYTAAEEWTSILKPAEYGARTLDDLQPALGGVASPDALLALFAIFFHHGLFFDWAVTDWVGIRQILEREILQERIRLPYYHGRVLYDRFNDTYDGTRTDHLMGPEAERLLQGAPVGVCQVGTFVSGPLGIVDSQESRWLPPSRYLPLWHCSDTGCNALHLVRLFSPSGPTADAMSRIQKALSDRDGPASEWEFSLSRLHRGFAPHAARAYVDLPLVVGNCLTGCDRTALLEAALLSSSGELLRQLLALPPRRKRDSEGPATQVASRLEPEAQLQLLLVLSDRALVGLIDDAVFSKAIRIPLGETRNSPHSPPQLPRDLESDLSALGIRSARTTPLVNITSAAWRAYQRRGQTNELEWRVRGDGARSTYDALVAFVRDRGPAETVRELILSSAEITKHICEELGIPLKYASGSEAVVVDRLLWKLGFNPMQFDDFVPRFRNRLTEFNEVILNRTPIDTEDARDAVRAAGVNVFVSVEDFLDRLISYNVWLLSSDHFLSEFHYSCVEARTSVPKLLGESLSCDDHEVQWSTGGENPLGTLLRYLREATDWIQRLKDKDRDSLRRLERDLPHFAADEVVPFPFRHIELWADSDPVELRRYSDLFGQVVKLVEESELANVRNGLDHFREPDRFPSSDKLLACIARLRRALGVSDVNRYLPKVYWLFARRGNRFGSTEYEFRDYADRKAIVYGPPLVSGLEPVAYSDACLLAPGNLLGTPNASLIFKLRERSEFSAFWQNYPRRRHIPPTKTSEGSSAKPDDQPLGQRSQ
jgi:hypothetical protein